MKHLLAALVVTVPLLVADGNLLAQTTQSATSKPASTQPAHHPWTGKLPARETHPCLFFASADIPKLKDRITRDPYKSWFARCPDKACIWLLTGDEKQAAAARNQLLNDPIPRERTHQYIEPSSHSFYSWVVLYDCLASWPGLSPEDHQKIRDKLAKEAEFYYQAMTEIKGGQNYGNQRSLGASALGLCALVLSDYRGSVHTPQLWLDMALWAIKCPDNFWFWRPDGMFVEGYGYTNYMGLLLVPFMSAYSRLTAEDLFGEPTLAAWLRYQGYFFLPDGRHINFGTSNQGEDRFGILFPLVANGPAGKQNAGLYAWGARRAYGDRLHVNLIVPALALFDESLRPDAESRPASAVFPACGQMVMKDGWADNLTGIWITGKGAGWAPGFYSTYSHADVTSFVIYSGQEFLAVDSGYTHWQGPDCSGPESHNLVMVDGKGPDANTLGKLRDAVISSRVDAATVETEYADHKVQRVFLFGEKRVLIVADFLAGKGKHDYLFQLHSPITVGKAQATIGERSAVWPGFDAIRNKVSPTTLNTFFAGQVQVKLIPSHWRPEDNTPKDNVAIGAKWEGQDGTALLSAHYAQQPTQPKVTVRSEDNLEVMRLEAQTDDWVIRAQARSHVGALTEGDAAVTARLLVTCRDVKDGKVGAMKWAYVWDAEKLQIPFLKADSAKDLRRGLLLWAGESWQIVAAADGV